MNFYRGLTAVVTGGGSGMGRQLVLQMAAAGCSVATCDLDQSSLDDTVASATRAAGFSAVVTGHVCDVADPSAVEAFRSQVIKDHGGVSLLFNNAGVAGGSSFVIDDREMWEKVFAVDWWGVYNCTRSFLPDLIRAKSGILVNTSSVNGFFASLGEGRPNTAYCTAKFAVKGFTESLVEDFRVNAPDLRVVLVMPGHIGTDIVSNSRRFAGLPAAGEMTEEQVEEIGTAMKKRGALEVAATAGEIRSAVQAMEDNFREMAPLDASGAAGIILQGVARGEWRILVGEDAKNLDLYVRSDPDGAYEPPYGDVVT